MAVCDLCVIGGGPAGLGVAIEARARGLDVVLVEGKTPPIDKACGEGIMPRGLARLEALGVLSLIEPQRTHPIAGLRYINEDGTSATAALPDGGGLGIRRVALSSAMWQRARDVGVRLYPGHRARWRGDGLVSLSSADGVEASITAELVVAADGLHSSVRRLAGLAVARTGPARFGLRQHLAVPPWSDHVEIHFADRIEAYVTPVGAREIDVAFLWTPRDGVGRDFVELLARFPSLATRLEGVEAVSTAAGLGPLAQQVRAVTAPRLCLLGDAAGYVDAITGEGISLALETAHALCAAWTDPARLERYQRAHARAFQRYARVARSLLWLAHRPALRRRVVAALSRRPRLFAALVRRLI